MQPARMASLRLLLIRSTTGSREEAAKHGDVRNNRRYPHHGSLVRTERKRSGGAGEHLPGFAVAVAPGLGMALEDHAHTALSAGNDTKSASAADRLRVRRGAGEMETNSGDLSRDSRST